MKIVLGAVCGADAERRGVVAARNRLTDWANGPAAGIAGIPTGTIIGAGTAGTKTGSALSG